VIYETVTVYVTSVFQNYALRNQQKHSKKPFLVILSTKLVVTHVLSEFIHKPWMRTTGGRWSWIGISRSVLLDLLFGSENRMVIDGVRW